MKRLVRILTLPLAVVVGISFTSLIQGEWLVREGSEWRTFGICLAASLGVGFLREYWRKNKEKGVG